MSYNPLTEEEKKVIEEKGTEKPFSGKYDELFAENAERRSTLQKTNSIPVAAGQVLMMK